MGMNAPNSTKPKRDTPKPYHKGGGWYVVTFPDGTTETVKGPDAAYELAGLPPPGKKTSNQVRAERRNNEITAEERRSKIAALLVRKVPYRQIASTLGVAIGTVASDVEKIRAEWRTSALDNLEDYVIEELATLDNDEYELRMLLQRQATVENRLRAYDRILKIRERRAKLLGLDAPTVQQVLLSPGPSAGGSDNLIFRVGGGETDYVETLKAAQGGDRRGHLRAIEG